MSNELPGNILPQIIGDNRRDITVATLARWVARSVGWLIGFSVAIRRTYRSIWVSLYKYSAASSRFSRRTPLEKMRDLLFIELHIERSKSRESGEKCGVHLETKREIFTRSKARETQKVQLANITNSWMLNARHIAGN